ncbi:MAG: hypothetical protein RLZZ303_3098 [Candidatus Hydrogenedentota bacterium]|jgi:uncharacterized damage-inducible protein DinB
MDYIDSVLQEFEHSIPATRKHLERLPEDKLSWKPAEKSLSLGALGLHMAESPGMISKMALLESLDVSGGPNFREPASVAEILDTFDAGCQQARENLEKLRALDIDGLFTFTAGGQALMQFPRRAVLREIFLNHTYHHRGQLGVYLRLLDVPVPSTFGPSADESI